jgi:uncharacterized protein YigA (DUF484 family)
MPNLKVIDMDKTDEIRRINLEIAMKFNKVEEQLSGVASVAGLFETLFAGIEKEFCVPFVWLTLVDSEKAAPVIAAVKSSAILKNRLNIISQPLFEQILPAGLQPVLANKKLLPYYKLLPPTNKFFIKSMAIVPFQLQDQIVGSWNNGDVLSDRYRPEMETGLLQILARKVSVRLTELVGFGK